MFIPRTSRVISLLVVLLMCPTIVLSQTYLKVAVCTMCSGFFIAYGCPTNYESLFCRLQAFQLQVLNCRTYPCVDYDAPIQNSCVDFPLGCPIQHIKIFGLCPFQKMCCGTKQSSSTFDQANDLLMMAQERPKWNLKHLLHLNQDDRSNAKKPRTQKTAASKLIQNKIDSLILNLNGSQPGVPRVSYLEQLMTYIPDNLDDPAVAEKTIMKEYEKFKQQITAINDEGEADGGSITIPSFQRFRAVALGHQPLK